MTKQMCKTAAELIQAKEFLEGERIMIAVEFFRMIHNWQNKRVRHKVEREYKTYVKYLNKTITLRKV